MPKFDIDLARKVLTERLKDKGRKTMLQQLKQLQAGVFVMCGGGMLGRSAAEQPEWFYVDTRVSRRPYSVTRIGQAVQVLCIYAELLGFDPTNLRKDSSDYFDVHNCGVW